VLISSVTHVAPLLVTALIECLRFLCCFIHYSFVCLKFSVNWGKERGLALPECAGKSTSHEMGLIILIVVILLLVGAFPTGGYGYGYRSHGVLGTVLIIILILYLLGRL
jgi:hypothetical protein